MSYVGDAVEADEIESVEMIRGRGETVTLERRLTRSYVGPYAHLDRWMPFGALELIAVESHAPDSDEPSDKGRTTYVGRIRCDDPSTPEMIEGVIRDTFSRHGCAHEWDCCGCISDSVAAVENEGGTCWSFEVHHSANY